MKLVSVKILALLVLSLGMTSCSKKGNTANKGVSSATGWKINDKKGGFQYNTNYKKQAAPPGMVSIEGGTFTMGKVEDDVMHDWNNSPTKQHVQSFFMDETEVTNMMYAEYLDWVKSVYSPTEDNYKHIYTGALPDTLVWRNRLGFNETMTNNYLRHPAYGNYPVVGVNWIQANEFCEWRTDRVAEDILEKNKFLKKDAKVADRTADSNFNLDTYLAAPSKTYGGNQEIVLQKGVGKKSTVDKDGNALEAKNVYAQRSSGLLPTEFRLPTEAEWEYAALALVGNREYNIYRGQKKYPWKGQYTRAGKRQIRGDQLANFKQGKGDYGGIAGWSDDGADITNYVRAYAPNDFGLYDMAGNVAEWVADVYRPIVDDEANDFNYYRGNMYMKNKIGEDGIVEVVTVENMKYDTLSNGKVVARSFPGQLQQVPVDQNETYLRTNFNTSDNRNYKDGDKQSSRYFRFNDEEQPAPGDSLAPRKKEDPLKRMYQAPIHKIEVDSTGKLIKNFDRSKERTTLIDDNVRVYKGGSWRDRAYWLDPASRRFFPQDMATDYIGFRCAAAKLGPKSNKKTPRGNVKN